MTHAGAGGGGENKIDLAALYVSILPETSHMDQGAREAGTRYRRGFNEGFNDGGIAEEMGNAFFNKFSQSFGNKLRTAKLGYGITPSLGFIDQLGEQVDAKLAAKLKGQLPQAYKVAATAANELQAVDRRGIEVSNRLTQAKQTLVQQTQIATQQERLYKDLRSQSNTVTDESTAAFRRATQARANANEALRQTTVLTKEQKSLNEEHTAGMAKMSAAHGEYTNKLGAFNEASAKATTLTHAFAGALGGLAVIGVQSIITGFETTISLGAHLFEEAIRGAVGLSEKLIEIGTTFEQLNAQTVEFSSATGPALDQMQAHVARIFGQLDVSGKDLGKTYAQLSSVLGIGPGADLDNLARRVTDLQGRFSNLKAADLASIFRDAKVPADQFNNSLATLAGVGQSSGQGLGAIVEGMKGETVEVLDQAGLSFGQIAAAVGAIEEHGVPANQVTTVLQKTMAGFAKEGLGFADGLRKLFAELSDPTVAKEEKERLAETYFGTRKWADGLAMIPDLLRVIGSAANEYDQPAEKTDQLIKNTETFDNKLAELKQHLIGMAAPFGIAFLGGVEGQLVKIQTWFDVHHKEIIDKIGDWAHKFVDMIPTLKDWAATFVEIMGVAAAAMAPLVAGTMEMAGAALLQYGITTFDTDKMQKGMDLMVKGGGILDAIPDIIDETEKWAGKIRDLKVPMSELNTGIDNTVQSAQALADKEQTLNEWNQHLGQSFAQMTPSGFAMPNATGPRIVPAAFSPGGGGDAEGPMKARIMQLSQQFGLSPVETAEVIGVGKHESNWSGPGYMGFGPEWAQATGSDFRSNPLGAVDQFFRQFMERRAKEGNPNDPQAVASYIWHVVHGAADPNYGPELLAASGFQHGGVIGVGAGILSGLLGSLGIGKGGIDDQLIRATVGETVMNKGASEKFGPLLQLLNAKGYAGGGEIDQFGVNIAGAQIDTIRIADALAQLAPGHTQGLYRGPDGYNEHASGEADDFMVGGDTALGYAVKDWALRQPGVMYALWQQTQWNPDGSTSRMEDRGGATQNHMDHVHIRTVGGGYPPGMGPGDTGLAYGSFPSGTQLSGGTGGFSMAGFGSAGGGGGRGGGGGLGPIGGGPLGDIDPRTGLPGVAGQYGGFGQYGGETQDQVIRRNRALQDARDRITGPGGLNDQIKDKQGEIDDLNREVTRLRGLPDLDPDKLKLSKEEEKLDRLQRQLKHLKEVELPRANEDIGTAEREQAEAAAKPPKGLGGGNQYGFAKTLGGQLLSGIWDSLGLSNVEGLNPNLPGFKAPWEFGGAKLGLSALNWGLGVMNRTGMMSGGGLGGSDSAVAFGGGNGIGLPNIQTPNFPMDPNVFGRGPLAGPPGTVAPGPGAGIKPTSPSGPLGSPNGPKSEYGDKGFQNPYASPPGTVLHAGHLETGDHYNIQVGAPADLVWKLGTHAASYEKAQQKSAMQLQQMHPSG